MVENFDFWFNKLSKMSVKDLEMFVAESSESNDVLQLAGTILHTKIEYNFF